MINEFKDFIAKGNVMDMAVGIIIGAAFTAKCRKAHRWKQHERRAQASSLTVPSSWP